MDDEEHCEEVPNLIQMQASKQDSPVSVMSGPLSSCSVPGTAKTGFTRDGKCQNVGNDDQGSHHICIKLNGLSPNFCQATGQPNWCATQGACMGQKGMCDRENWCVCQWAFARYIAEAGGCDKIVDLECDATNMAAFRAYEASKEPTHKTALECIKSKCGIA